MAFWAPYVPVAKRRAKAQREMNKLRKKGQDIQPIAIEGRTIARSFWGKGWCDHLESFSDFANRLPRGRTYVRNGSVCHLGIHPGRVDAMVSGSELYNVTIRINELKTATWESIKTKCSGQIGSVLELIQGKLSNQVMGIVADRDQGLFPKPSEIKLSCSCPDWATMCKHVAAVLYGVGSRLDDRPELLFLLREVDAAELIATEMALPDTAATGDSLADDQLGDIFGIDLDMEIKAPPALQVKIKQSKAKKQRRQRAAIAPQRQPSPVTKTRRMVTSGTPASRARNATSSASRRTTASRSATPQPRATAKRATAAPSNLRPTGKSVARLRRQHGLSVAQFAAQLGVSAATVYRWETTSGRLNLQARPLNALAALLP